MDSHEIVQWQDQEALKRFQSITPLLAPDLDDAKKMQLRRKIAQNNGISVRTLFRYEAAYREKQFNGLKPQNRKKHLSQKLPANWDEVVAQAVILKREVPKRSVRTISQILEMEGWVTPGSIKRSTLQRYLFDAGFGAKQMRRYAEARETSSRRFCRPHRMELVQGDIKYGPKIRTASGRIVKTYLSTLLDDHSRFILQSEFYDNQQAAIVEDTFHKAVLQWGAFDCAYLDNGTQYISKQLARSCARLGIRLLHAAPRNCAGKGKIERFHQTADRFIAEVAISHVHSVEELNCRWKAFLDQDYQKKPHDGIRDYYSAQGVEIPSPGISPLQEWDRDTRALRFIDTRIVGEAFLHHEDRTLDKAGCFPFQGALYEASSSLAGAKVEIAYDPQNTGIVHVYYQDMDPIEAHRTRIGPYADKKAPVPVSMTDQVPQTSRLLKALEKNYTEQQQMVADAISFGSYRKDGE